MDLVRRTWMQDFRFALGVAAVVLLMTGSVLLGLRWDLSEGPAATQQPSLANDSSAFDEAALALLHDPAWHQLLYRITVVDFCGQQTWHVREGYRINRNRLQAERPISIARAAEIRSEAISLVERQMNQGGVQNYAYWCSVRGGAAASHFRSVWSQSMART